MSKFLQQNANAKPHVSFDLYLENGIAGKAEVTIGEILRNDLTTAVAPVLHVSKECVVKAYSIKVFIQTFFML